ncbi:hypothetical protein IGK30_002913 [Enterococcus sp. AZ178]|nr:MAG TPA: hypothetical protein [Caudoviricetes sp.]
MSYDKTFEQYCILFGSSAFLGLPAKNGLMIEFVPVCLKSPRFKSVRSDQARSAGSITSKRV